MEKPLFRVTLTEAFNLLDRIALNICMTPSKDVSFLFSFQWGEGKNRRHTDHSLGRRVFSVGIGVPETREYSVSGRTRRRLSGTTSSLRFGPGKSTNLKKACPIPLSPPFHFPWVRNVPFEPPGDCCSDREVHPWFGKHSWTKLGAVSERTWRRS